jgi:hypothetical protein
MSLVPLEAISSTVNSTLHGLQHNKAGHENSLKVLNNVSLWNWCTGRVTGFFASMPLTGKATNVNEGRDQDESIPHVTYADYLYNPATDVDSAPSRDHDQASPLPRCGVRHHNLPTSTAPTRA